MNQFINIAIGISLIFNSAIARKSLEDLEEVQDHCVKGTNIANGSVPIDHIICNDKETDQEMKCFWKCLLTEVEWIDSHGNLREAPYVRDQNSKVACMVPLASTCMNSTGVDDCDKAYNFAKCITDNGKTNNPCERFGAKLVC